MKSVLSIITINYNNKEGLERTIKSVINQNVPLEYIIIDGGSTDGSVEIIKQYEKNIDSCIIESDRGIYDAMNKGIIRAKGEFLMFLNSGDSLTNAHTIMNCLSIISTDTAIDIWYGDMAVSTTTGFTVHTHPKVLSLDFLKNDTINHQASFIRKEIFSQLGLYADQYKLAADYRHFLLSFISNKKFNYINCQIVNYDFLGLSGKDNFVEYKKEQRIIWNMYVPEYVDELIDEIHRLKLERKNYKQIMNYKIINTAIKLNRFIQKIRGKTLFK